MTMFAGFVNGAFDCMNDHTKKDILTVVLTTCLHIFYLGLRTDVFKGCFLEL